MILLLSGDLDTEGPRVVVAEGGRGGCYDNRWSGEKGQGRNIKLILKLIADVGLLDNAFSRVDFPAFGKLQIKIGKNK